MTTYRKIHGRSIQAVTTDPTESIAEGQVWYNTSSDTFKTVLVSEAWSSGSSQTIFREGACAVTGTTTAGLLCGGSSPSAPYTNKTEEYNGSGWSAGGNLGTGRSAYGSAGTQTAGLTAGGYNGSNLAVSESYNGTSWSEGPDINTARRAYGTCGTQTAALLVGGYTTTSVNTVEEYDGSSWTTVTSAPTNNYSAGMAGIQTSAIQIAGATNPGQACVEYDGTNWTAGGSLNTGRSQGGYAGTTRDSAMAISGETPPGTKTVNCEQYDGTSWSEIVNVSTAGNPSGNSPAGSTSTAFFSSGQSRPKATEEYNKSANVITAAAWASGGNLNTGRNGAGGAGPQTAAMAYGGQQNPGTATKGETEQYDGTSWTEVSDLNTVRYTGGPSIQGTQTATIYFGGARQNPDVAGYNNTETWNGSSWSEVANLNEAREEVGGAGTSTSAVGFGGNPAGATTSTATEEWDGSSWTSVNAMPAADRAYAGSGSQTAALGSGGYSTTTSSVTATEEFTGETGAVNVKTLTQS